MSLPQQCTPARLLKKMRHTFETDRPAPIGIDLIHQVIELGFRGFKSQLAHYAAQFSGCDFTYIWTNSCSATEHVQSNIAWGKEQGIFGAMLGCWGITIAVVILGKVSYLA